MFNKEDMMAFINNNYCGWDEAILSLPDESTDNLNIWYVTADGASLEDAYLCSKNPLSDDEGEIITSADVFLRLKEEIQSWEVEAVIDELRSLTDTKVYKESCEMDTADNAAVILRYTTPDGTTLVVGNGVVCDELVYRGDDGILAGYVHGSNATLYWFSNGDLQKDHLRVGVHHEEIRELFVWESYGLKGDSTPTNAKMKDLSTQHLHSLVHHFGEDNKRSLVFQDEISYREDNNIDCPVEKFPVLVLWLNEEVVIERFYLQVEAVVLESLITADGFYATTVPEGEGVCANKEGETAPYGFNLLNYGLAPEGTEEELREDQHRMEKLKVPFKIHGLWGKDTAPNPLPPHVKDLTIISTGVQN